MSTNPEEIRRDIERTRAELSDNVNALGDSAKPSNIVREQVDQVKEGVHSFKERIFGSDTNPYDHGAVGAVGDKAGTLVEDARESVADAPRQVKASTRGNPPRRRQDRRWPRGAHRRPDPRVADGEGARRAAEGGR